MTQLMLWLIKDSSDIETQMNSVERMGQYIEIAHELEMVSKQEEEEQEKEEKEEAQWREFPSPRSMHVEEEKEIEKGEEEQGVLLELPTQDSQLVRLNPPSPSPPFSSTTSFPPSPPSTTLPPSPSQVTLPP